MANRSVRLVQFTDTHLLADPAGAMRGAVTLPRLEACIAHARRHFFPVDAIAITGDIVQDEPSAYGSIELLFDRLGVPVLLIPGSHDDPAELRHRLGAAPFQVGGEFRTANGWQVLLLESWFAESNDGEGRLGTRQLAELERTLAAGTDPHVFVFVHHPPVPMESAGLDALGLLDAGEFLEIITRHPRVRACAWGHAHQALDIFARNGLRLMCTPATSMQFTPRQTGFSVDDRPPGYRILDLHTDGSIATEVVWLEGHRDSGSSAQH